MSISYTLRESVAGFRRAKLSSVLSVLTICISLLLLGLFVAVTVNAGRVVDALRARLEMEAFLVEPATDEEIASLIGTVQGLEGVERIVYISKDEAALIFKQEFGEDINQVLDFNPLPPSFKIILREPYRNAARANEVSAAVAGVKGIESVTYRRTLLEIIDTRAAGINKVMLTLGIIVSLSAVFLVSNTIRLAIHARKNILRTMELVGATRGFIRFPFLLEGLTQGLLGGLAAAGLLWFLFDYAARLAPSEFAPYLSMPPALYAGVVAAGMVLGFAGSLISVLRFVRPSAAH